MSNLTKRILSLFFTGGIVIFVIGLLVTNLDDLKGYEYTFDGKILLFSGVLAVLNVVILGYIWHSIFFILSGIRMPLPTAARIFIYGWLGKYVPGKVWSSISKIHLGRQEGYDTQALIVTSFFELALSTLAQFFVAGVLILLYGSEYISAPLLLFVIILSLVLLHPRVITLFFVHAARFIGKEFNDLCVSQL